MIDKLSVYKNKRVLITGHTGFKGSWLTLWLSELGAEILGYSLEPPTQPSLFDILKLEKKIKHVFGDIRNEEKLKKTMIDFQPEFVFHLAAQPLVRLSYQKPKETYETNVIGTVNVLEAVRSTESVKVSVNITTDKCYENKEWIYGYREEDPIGGYDPYSSSKGCAELVIGTYRASFFNPEEYGKNHNTAISSARAGNVIGGGDWACDRLVPDCIKALIEQKTIVLRNPNAVRPWQHVLEPLYGYLLLGANMYADGKKYSGAWNFGPGDNEIIPVEDLVKKIIKTWGSGEYEIINDKKLHEAGLLKLDISKARFLMNWKPVLDINQTVENTVLWYKKYHLNKADINEFTLYQLKNFIDKHK
jgi:CDP-glucose 4,6-dehydratase